MKRIWVGAWTMLLLAVSLVTPVHGQGVDNPSPLDFFVPAKVSLDENEINYFSISLPAGDFKIVLDTRRADGTNGNLISGLSILDRDGAVIKDKVIGFNEIDWAYRRVYSFGLTKPTKVQLRLTNYHSPKTDFWLTVLKMAEHKKPKEEVTELKDSDLKETDLKEYDPKKVDLIPFPFFGKVLPKLILPEQTKTGVLEEGESVYFITILPKGEHKVILGFDNAKGENGNLIGYLALLNADGGGQETLIGMNEIDITARKTAGFVLKKPAVVVFRVQCGHRNAVKYTLKVRPTASD